MNLFILNGLLAVGWAAVNGTPTAASMVTGFVVGYFLLWLVRPALGASRYHDRVAQVARFLAHFLVDLVRSNWRIAWDVLTPELRNKPGIVAVPLRAKTDLEITALANLISLTPGTLSLALSADRRTLYVHAMGLKVGRLDDFRREIRDGIEQHVLELSRGRDRRRSVGSGLTARGER